VNPRLFPASVLGKATLAAVLASCAQEGSPPTQTACGLSATQLDFDSVLVNAS
jgi:hypothetical protein